MSQFPRPQPVVIVRSGDWRPFSGWATASFVLGLVSLCGGFALIVPPVLAVVFGHIAMRRIRDGGMRGAGMAVTGLTIGYAITLLGVIAAIGELAGIH